MASAVIMAGLTGNAISAGGILKSAFVGAISGVVTFGIGSIFSVAGGTFTTIAKSIDQAIGSFGLTMVQAGTHAISQGVMSLVQSGGSGFLSGAISGFLGHMGAEAWGAAMKGVGMSQFSQSTAGMVTFGAISGGIGAELSGGNFWQGAVTGGIVAGLNSAMHKIESDLSDDDPRKPKGSKRVRSTDEAHSLKGSRGGATAVIPKIGDGPKAGQGPGIFVPSGSQSMVTADMTYYDDGTVDINMTTQVSRMNTTGSYIAGYQIIGPNGNIIDAKFLAIPKYNRMDYPVYTSKGSPAVLSTATFRNIQ
jgi:hypothetical protein